MLIYVLDILLLPAVDEYGEHLPTLGYIIKDFKEVLNELTVSIAFAHERNG